MSKYVYIITMARSGEILDVHATVQGAWEQIEDGCCSSLKDLRYYDGYDTFYKTKAKAVPSLEHCVGYFASREARRMDFVLPGRGRQKEHFCTIHKKEVK